MCFLVIGQWLLKYAWIPTLKSVEKKTTDVQANKQVNRQTDKQTNKQKTEQINKQTIKPCKIKGNAESVRAKNLYEL